jgi:hypothetical protein
VLYSGAVASAFSRVSDAEKYFRRAIREASSVALATDAREALINLYMRVGRSSDAARVLDDAIAAAPSRSDFRNVRALFGAPHPYLNQTARAGRRETFRCSATAHGLFIPVSVNGKTVEWYLDTAFSMSALSESEARMLGVTVPNASAQVGDFAGGTTTARTAVAARVVIGGTELRNVMMLVFPDSQPPWNDQPPGKRGAIGLPAAVALQTIHWTTRGICQVGPGPNPQNSRAEMNLAFDGSTPVTRASFEGQPLDLVLDTGNQGGTQLWQRFTRDFAALVQERGTPSTQRVNQIGGSTERAIVVVPDLHLRVGGFDTVLHPASIFSRPVGNDVQHGDLGMDLLGQASDVTIDFQSMSVILR